MIDGQGLDGQDAWNNDIQSGVSLEDWLPDDSYKGTDAGDQPQQSFIEKYDFQPTNNHIKKQMAWILYKGIARTNDVINTLSEVKEVGDTRRKQIIAEARFLRGLFHFEAKKMWKTIPYIDENVYKLDDLESTKIPNDKDVWPLIEADFKAAPEGLPENSVAGWTSNQMGCIGVSCQKPTCTRARNVTTESLADTAVLQKAKPVLEQIIASGKFSLAPKFEDNFLIATRNNVESIFEIQYAGFQRLGRCCRCRCRFGSPIH
ncbi:RagB/SusD family nutrient uptake outer membrane protein [Paucibacter sp. O1-1]|nr:RagB/SusD family nutrient uptake outer membrane protein [Paucibacter sp. O1-1]MDA3831681.1 RagB/SusD family nutrient uptake outer membrane protein [Paucibacter sp. O1-1]